MCVRSAACGTGTRATTNRDVALIREIPHQRLEQNGTLTVFTDGSCLDNPHGPAGWAWWVTDELWACGGTIPASNQWAELMAIHQVLGVVPPTVPLQIVSDSLYALNAIFVWSPRWRTKSWHRGGKPVMHTAIIQPALERWEARTAPTFWTHIRGHHRDKSVAPWLVHGNKQADLLATRVSASIRDGHPVPSGYPNGVQ